MKKLKYIISSTIVTLLLFGCDAEQAGLDLEPVGSTDRYPTPTFTFSGGATTFNEKDEPVFTYSIVLDKPTDRPIDFSFVQIGGDAEVDHDFVLENATVPAYATTAKMSVIILNDLEAEGTETLQLNIESGPSLANKYLVHPDTQYPGTLSLTIQNNISDDLVMSFDWERDINYAGTDYSTCVNIDLDIFVSDAAGFDINDPWSTFNGTNYAASADCPEVMDWVMSDWGDGDYVIWHEVWSNGFRGLGTNTLVPITASIVRPGAFSVDITQDDSQAMNSDNDGEADENPSETHGVICLLTVSNGTYKVSDYAGNELASGRLSNRTKTERPSSIQKIGNQVMGLVE